MLVAVRGALGVVAMLALVGCEADGDGDTTGGFGHGSPRPACQQAVASEEVAYFGEPVVVAPGWGDPVPLSAPVTDACPNDAIEISRDGRTLYFFWSPVVNGSDADLLAAETGTYKAELVGDDPGVFGEPTYFELQTGVEGGSVDGAPSFSPDGDWVVFHSTRAANLGYLADPATNDYLDLYVSEIVDGVPGPATNLGEPVNSVYLDGEHTLSPDGSRLFFTSDRPGGLGGTDLWVSERTGPGWGAGAWGDPINLGQPINTPANDLQPAFVADDPDTMYFASDRDGPTSIYRSSWDGSGWGTPEMVITGYVGEPALVADGSVLYFIHVLVNDDGVYGSNIWYVERTG